MTAMKRAAFVTGGASGIGLSICEHLARAGHSVAVADYNGDGAEDVAKAIRDSGGQAIAVPVDVSDRCRLDKAVAAARGEFGAIGILVTSAAVSRREPFEQMSAESWERRRPGMTHYAASKGGVIAFGKALALEVAARGVTVNNIAPSVIETPMVAQQRAAGAVASREAMASRVPVGRMGTGDDIAAACLYLVSEEASYVTGQTVSVNGGSFVGW